MTKAGKITGRNNREGGACAPFLYMGSASAMPHIEIVHTDPGVFSSLLQQGCGVRGTVGRTVAAFLRETTGISDRYMAERIQTAFLNGRPLDDFHGAYIEEGDVLALSAALPGLLGATLRKGGFYAGMRSGISHCAQRAPERRRQGRITLKLFNLAAREMAPGVLLRGAWFTGEQLADFFSRRFRAFIAGCVSMRSDGLPVDPKKSRMFASRGENLFLTVHPAA